jgi:UDP-N-acetylmuramate--alanine ligase
MMQCRKRVHFIGIGGVGMSALAELLLSMGAQVSGSDRQQSYLTGRLSSLGAKIQFHHEPELVKQAQIVVYSSAIREDNAERTFATLNGITQIRRAELLGDLTRSHYCVGIAGTHGKTTITSLTGHVFIQTQRDPTILVGGVLKSTGATARVGQSRYMVVEADEYDRSFLSLYPTVAVISNIEADHLDCYRDVADVEQTFARYAEMVPFYGVTIVCGDDAGVQRILPAIRSAVLTYGLSDGVDWQARDIVHHQGRTSFSACGPDGSCIPMEINLAGEHNVRNALAALSAAVSCGIDAEAAARAAASFSGVKRRFELVDRVGGISVIDDYAHHPGEIRATLAAARTQNFSRVVAVFQPHLYTRTRDFLADFATTLAAADIVVLTAIYQAREEPIEGVSSQAIAQLIRQSGHAAVWYVDDKDEIAPLLGSQLRAGDAVVVMGAGDIVSICTPLIEELRRVQG